MALAAVVAGNRIVISDLNAYYNLLKGVTGSGENITLIYNAAASLIFQPSSDPAAGTEAVQIKNNAGTVQSALSFDGRFYPADGLVGTPGIAFQSDKDTGVYRIGTNNLGIATAGVKRVDITAAGLTTLTGPTTAGAQNILTVEHAGASIGDSAVIALLAAAASGSTTASLIRSTAPGAGVSDLELVPASTGIVKVLGTTGALAIGTNPATSDVIRIPNNKWLTARNAANSANVPLIGLDPGDQINLGGGSTNAVVMGAAAGGKFIAQGTLTAGGLLATAVQICTSGPLIYSGSGVPSISAAVKGSLYLRSDGTSTTTRAYIATDTAGTWTAITTAA